MIFLNRLRLLYLTRFWSEERKTPTAENTKNSPDSNIFRLFAVGGCMGGCKALVGGIMKIKPSCSSMIQGQMVK